jgi:hypothetical protein
MAEDSLRSAIDAIGRRLQEELEEQLTSFTTRHQDEVEAARRAAEADAEQRWSARVDAVRAEWTARLESEVAVVRADAERRMVAEAMRLRADAEQAAAETVERVRAEAAEAATHLREGALQAAARQREESTEALARQREEATEAMARLREEAAGAARHQEEAAAAAARLQEALDSAVRQHQEAVDGATRLQDAHERAQQELHAAASQVEHFRQQVDGLLSSRQSAEALLEDERRGRAEDAARLAQQAVDAAADARAAERQAQLAIIERLLGGIRTMDTARSLSDVLAALLAHAAAETARVALFVVNDGQLRGWKAAGFHVEAAALHGGHEDGNLLADALRRGEPVVTNGAGPFAPPFAELPPDRAAIAVPLLVGGQPVAVLYADDGAERARETPAAWPEAIQLLGRHASVNLAHLTAARAAEAMRRSLAPPAPAAAGARVPPPVEDGQSARRYARLLVSEIKLYNEPAVRQGREQRDLLERLKPEIERARRLYDERISSAIDARGALFHQELVETLAGGDPSRLGGSA